MTDDAHNFSSEDKNESSTPLSHSDSSTSGLLAQGKEIVSSYKLENDRREALIRREEDLKARQLMAGNTDAGIQPVQPKEETPAEYAKRLISGKL